MGYKCRFIEPFDYRVYSELTKKEYIIIERSEGLKISKNIVLLMY